MNTVIHNMGYISHFLWNTVWSQCSSLWSQQWMLFHTLKGSTLTIIMVAMPIMKSKLRVKTSDMVCINFLNLLYHHLWWWWNSVNCLYKQCSHTYVHINWFVSVTWVLIMCFCVDRATFVTVAALANCTVNTLVYIILVWSVS